MPSLPKNASFVKISSMLPAIDQAYILASALNPVQTGQIATAIAQALDGSKIVKTDVNIKKDNIPLVYHLINLKKIPDTSEYASVDDMQNALMRYSIDNLVIF